MKALLVLMKHRLQKRVHHHPACEPGYHLGLGVFVFLILSCAFVFMTPANSFPQINTAEQEYRNGVALLEARKFDQAIAAFNAALRSQPGHQQAYQKIGEAYQKKITFLNDSGKYEAAIHAGQSALAGAVRHSDFESRCRILRQIGNANFRMGNYTQALELYQKSLYQAQRSGKRSLQPDPWNGIGLVYEFTGECQKAIAAFHEALKLYRELSDKGGEGMVLGNLGDSHMLTGEYDQALSSFVQALDLLREAGDRQNEAATLDAIATAYGYQGKFPESFKHYRLALQAYRAIHDRSGESNALANIGANHLEQGNPWQALQYFKRALTISTELKEKYKQQIHLGNVGNAYFDLGDFTRAAEAFTEARKIAQDIGDLNNEAMHIADLGHTLRETGQTESALRNFQDALAIFERLGDKRSQATANADIANLRARAGNYDETRVYFERALKLHQEIGNAIGVAETNNGLGTLYLTIGEMAKSRLAHEKALALGEQMHALRIIWEAKYGLAKLAARDGNLLDARRLYVQAIDSIEAARARILSTDHKAYFLSNRDDIYKSYIDLLFQLHQREPYAGFDREAFHYSERAKARGLLDLLAEARVRLERDMPRGLQKQQETAFHQIAAIQTQLQQAALTENERTDLLKKLAQAEQTLQDLTIIMKRKNPKFARLEYPEIVQLADFQRRMSNEKDLVLAYALGKEGSYLWAITSRRHFFFRLPPASRIEKDVKSYIALIDTAVHVNVSHRTKGQELFELLMGSVGDLVAKAKKIIIIPDGMLHGLPFESLLTPGANGEPKYVIEQTDIVYAPSATVMSFLNSDRQASHTSNDYRLLAFADPVFEANEVATDGNDARNNGEPVAVDLSAPDSSIIDSLGEKTSLRGLYESLGKKFERLLFTAEEVDSIAQFFPPSDKTVYRRYQAVEERLKQTDLKQFAILHFATHGILDERHPGRSSLVLTLDSDPLEDGFLQLNEIFNLELNAELVVLSACETATGRRLPGEGLLGMTRAFLYAGAESVLGSLWRVSDKSTAKLMTRFYRHMFAGKSRSQALRLAKCDLLRSVPYRHPYYWAAFVLLGSKQ